MQDSVLYKIKIRPFTASDSLEELTKLLNVAYKKLADQGLKYVASQQDAQITKSRIEKGQGFIALLDNKLVGTITYYSPSNAKGCEWYDQPFVAKYGQFAVEPSLQKSGIGGLLVDLVEKQAIADNAKEIAIDTAEGATELIRFYAKRGYRFVGSTQWKSTNYRSVLLSKTLPDS